MSINVGQVGEGGVYFYCQKSDCSYHSSCDSTLAVEHYY